MMLNFYGSRKVLFDLTQVAKFHQAVFTAKASFSDL